MGVGVRLRLLVVAAVGVLLVLQPGGLGRVLRLFGEQRVAVGARDLVIVRVNLGKGEKAVAVAAELNKRGLQRGFDPHHPGQVDVALQLFVFGGFEVELLDPASFSNRDPGFFPVPRVDQHARCHWCVSDPAGRVGAAGSMRTGRAGRRAAGAASWVSGWVWGCRPAAGTRRRPPSPTPSRGSGGERGRKPGAALGHQPVGSDHGPRCGADRTGGSDADASGAEGRSRQPV